MTEDFVAQPVFFSSRLVEEDEMMQKAPSSPILSSTHTPLFPSAVRHHVKSAAGSRKKTSKNSNNGGDHGASRTGATHSGLGSADSYSLCGMRYAVRYVFSRRLLFACQASREDGERVGLECEGVVGVGGGGGAVVPGKASSAGQSLR